MAEDLLDHWVGLITSIFPSNAWIVSRYSGNDHIIQIDWKLTNDLQQKNRRSKKIQITIKEEAIDDYLDKDERARDIYNTFLKRFICERYDRFDPDQDDLLIKAISVSAEKWLVSRDFLNMLPSRTETQDV